MSGDVQIWRAQKADGTVDVLDAPGRAVLQQGKIQHSDGTIWCAYPFAIQFARPVPDPEIYRVTITARKDGNPRTTTWDLPPDLMFSGGRLPFTIPTW
ncbi:hypothetical protein [Nocardia asiatica]